MCMSVYKSRKKQLTVYINYLCILCFQIPAYFYNLLSIYKNIFSDRHIPRYYCTILQ